MSTLTVASWPGISVHGRQTRLYLMTSEDFVKSPYCQAVLALTNLSFSKFQPPYIDSSIPRVSDVDQYKAELGGLAEHGRPLSSVFILAFSDPQECDLYPLGVISSCVSKLSPYHDLAKLHEKLKDNERIFARPKSVCTRVPGVVDWEIKLLVTGIEYRRQGIADYLINTCYEEMKRRTAKAMKVFAGLEAADWDTEYVIDRKLQKELESDKETAQGLKTRVLLSTIEELLQNFFVERGYTCDASVEIPAGTMGGVKGWHIAYMSKTLD